MTTYRAIRPYVTAQATELRLSQQPDLPLARTANPQLSVVVDPRVRYQTIEGFGGAFTESAAVTYYKMSPDCQAEILRAYFDPVAGLGYNLCRTHINSCDFSVSTYAYAEVPDDMALEHFTIEHERTALIPMIKAAQQVAPKPFRMIATPWSPPAWMKTNNDMCHGGQLKPEYRAVWAQYFCRFVREYEKEGIPIWGLTMQNEPQAVQTWESCIFSGEEARDFVRDYLGPTLAEAGLASLRLMIWDHNRDVLFDWIKPVLDDPQAAQYVWGTAFHWYVADCYDNLLCAHEAYPDKKLLFTEGCPEGGPHLGEWGTGERYGKAILNDLNHWAVGWVDWNLVLDETGGPNHVGNFCSAPIIAHTQTGELLYQSSYYYIGHFSRFIQPGAERILCASPRDELQATAFRNPDGQIVVVVLNLSDQRIAYSLKIDGCTAPLTSLPHSIATYVLDA
ncbi:MAG: glycoside hydrolase family 30 protein [Anaerolineae bacterium]|nr:glycoside hydrolase family 30 protein [Anaerolineae bacterium]